MTFEAEHPHQTDKSDTHPALHEREELPDQQHFYYNILILELFPMT